MNGAPAGDLCSGSGVKRPDFRERRRHTCVAKSRSTSLCGGAGGEIEVPTPDGSVKLKVPGETQTGKLFRMRGKGVGMSAVALR